MTSLLLPNWSSDLKYGPCPPARDLGSRVFGLVYLAEIANISLYSTNRAHVSEHRPNTVINSLHSTNTAIVTLTSTNAVIFILHSTNTAIVSLHNTNTVIVSLHKNSYPLLLNVDDGYVRESHSKFLFHPQA